MARKFDNVTDKGFFYKNLWFFGLIAVAILLIIAIFSTRFWRNVIICALLDGFIVVQLFSKSRKYNLIEKLAAVFFGIIYSVFSFIGWTRIGWGLLFVYVLFCLGAIFYIYFKGKKRLSIISVFGGLAIIRLLRMFYRFNYLSGYFKFWLLPLIIASMATIVSVIIVIRKCAVKRGLTTTEMRLDKPKSLSISVALLTFVCAFSVLWIGLNVLNYTLDSSTPVLKTYTVIDKKQRGGGKTLKKYDLVLDSEELTLSVDIYTYKNYEIGEEITISVYQGAFNEAYYVYENK
ncbi:MAG: hypothetical protein IJA89_05355 [Clostridia bacterium]|nr:hypothetical protein [Clostridia bacterium]